MFNKREWSREYWRKNKEIMRQKLQAYRTKTANAVTHRYEKTVNGFLMRMYRNMQSRVTGVQKKKAHLYKGKALLAREDFYAWAKSSKEFSKLFAEWKHKGYPRKLAPSVDRIDPLKGYILSNMEWVTHSENSRRSSKTR